MDTHDISYISWPPNSPDLNPIEVVWCWMKDFIQYRYGLVEKPGLPHLRLQLAEAWDSIDQVRLDALLATMPARCQAVIDANGMYTKY